MAAHEHVAYSHHGSTFRCRCGATSGGGRGPWTESATRGCSACAAPTTEGGAEPLCAWHRGVASEEE